MTLNLVLKYKWYDLIASGDKLEEYREIRPYWCAHFMPPHYLCEKLYTISPINSTYLCGVCGMLCKQKDDKQFKSYTKVRFHRGYTSTTMTFEIESISIGKGREEWGAEPNKEYFIIKLGNRVL